MQTKQFLSESRQISVGVVLDPAGMQSVCCSMLISFPMTFFRYDDSLSLSYEQEEPAPPAPSREKQSYRQIGQNNKQP